MTAKVHGAKELSAKFRALPAAIRAEMGPALAKSAEDMAALARGLAPVDSGALRDSIRVESDHELHRRVVAGGPETTREVRAGSGAPFDYALAVEHGTNDTPETPFFWPAFRVAGRKARARIRRGVSKAARKVASK